MNDSAHEKNVPAESPHPIVGIGASAGGLEALEQFLSHVPDHSGMAFVVIQHLDPNYKGLMPELLQRITKMKVAQAVEHMPVEADCVYVIPPNKDLSILHGALHLLDPVAPRGLRLPIDYFFRALAEDQHERAIGVILSGMGSDGTLGLRAIKEKAGLVLVQTPASAQFDGMPRSAIDKGLADIIAPAEELPDKIVSYLRHLPCVDHSEAEPILEPKPRSALEEVVTLLRVRTGNDFALYKKNTILRRVERRMGLHQIDDMRVYARYLRENPQELDLLFKELLIGVTSFFRDPSVWEHMKTAAIPALLAAYPGGKDLRAWVPACSTGEEAYTLAIVFKETLQQLKLQGRFTLQIFATDLDENAIDQARKGSYPGNIAVDVSPERLTRFFVCEENGYQVNKEIRETVIFAPQNIITDPPFTKLDILCCRNLLIYLGPELQKKLLPLFHYALVRRGCLLLGNAESVGGFTDLFTPIDNQSRIYLRTDKSLPVVEVDFPKKDVAITAAARKESKVIGPPANLQTLVEQFLLENFAPAAVLINADGDILYISGRTGKYLEPAAGKANWNIHAMAREGLRHGLAMGLKKVLRQPETVHVSGVTIGSNGGKQAVNLTIQAIDKPEALRGMLAVVFTEVQKAGKSSTRKQQAENEPLLAELHQAREELQTLREEMQTSQEELKSSNEELQSTNEELQSTNEELMTSKEEMQSMNEELQTVNTELQSKVDELSRVNNDMNNLLNSMEIATVFLDNALHIRRFTNHATHLFKLIAGDIGRPLSDIATDLDYPQLHHDAQEVLRTLVFTQKQITTRDGRWYKVRIMPYRTQDNVIDGVVITFIDFTETKKMEAELRRKPNEHNIHPI